MKPLRFAVFGAGFWSRYQLAGWRELSGAQCVAICNRTRGKAERLAGEFQIPAVYDDPEELLAREQLDFVDVITDVETHRPLVELAAQRGLAAVCQKPLGPTLGDAQAMVAACQQAGVPLLVNENWRWQTPLRRLRQILAEGSIGRIFRARIDYCSAFPVFDNQPFLKEVERFILADMGTHILDVARFLFGEATSLYCRTHRVHEDIRGEDVATVVMNMDGATVTANLSYASLLEHDRFPETLVLVEGTRGSVELAADHWLRITTAEGTTSSRTPPAHYPWADPRYGLIHASIVDCQRNLLDALAGRAAAETTAEDNLRTLALVEAAYESACKGRTIAL
jgi:D-apiose dehydrogenase